MSTELNKTIHANEQIGAAMREWITAASLDEVRSEIELLYDLITAGQRSGAPPRFQFWTGLAAIKLMEVLEQKEREAANGL